MKLKEQIDAQVQSFQRERGAQAELQAALVQVRSANAQRSQQLADEEKRQKDLQESFAGLQAKLTAAQEEHAALLQQLQLERDVHQKELKSIEHTLARCRQERDEIQAQVHKRQVTPLFNALPLYSSTKEEDE